MSLEGKVALVTGGGGGLGRACVLELAGHSVIPGIVATWFAASIASGFGGGNFLAALPIGALYLGLPVMAIVVAWTAVMIIASLWLFAIVLKRAGFKDVRAIPGSMTAWKNAGYPVASKRTPPPAASRRDAPLGGRGAPPGS